ncbi:hypothetical protein LF1_32970 [Rubripirellula obstinata]|uniref:Uncharacterized protein n=1 Tax=Rubripirellula obstinata TaxID=406547 RepID=A0A5B1CJL1_9BACT|nr:hypothetical protein [Rubripirellula obstinata]KAA1260756.1 hypothetical protein LF1_32970 [Rubripirellula obstinata]
MARQESLGQYHLTFGASTSLRWSFLLSFWISAAFQPICFADEGHVAEQNRAESAADSIHTDSQAKRLRLVAGKSLRIVQANEKMPWVFQIQATSSSDSADIDDDPLTLSYSVHQAGLGHKVLSGRREILFAETEQSQTISLDDRSPKEAGVYEVRFQLVRRSDNLWARLRPKEIVLEELRVPMLVQLPPSAVSPLSSRQSTSWQTIGEIRPSDTAMALGQWLPDSAARLIPGVRYVKGNLQKGQADGESISIVQPKSVFQAKLPIMAIGYPHRITIRCPRDQARGLRIDLGHGADQTQSRFSSLVQSRDSVSHLGAYRQDENGQATNDQGDDPSRTASDDRWLTRTYLYYPQPDDQVWLTNLNESDPVAFESITVTAGPATSTNLVYRKSVGGPMMRGIVLSISDPSWIQTWTEDWQSVDESPVCEPRSIGLHQSWLAAHRVVEQAQAMGASSLSIPVAPIEFSSPSTAIDDQEADSEAVVLNVFERFDIAIKPQVSLVGNQADSLQQTIKRFSEFRCFDGLVITMDQSSEVTKDTLDVLKKLSRTKRLLVRTDGRLNEKTQQDIAGIEGAVLVANFDFSGSVRPASDFSSAGSPRMTGVAVIDDPIARQDPAGCLFEIIHRSSPSVVVIDEAVVKGTVDDQLNRISKSFEALPVSSVKQLEPLDPGDGTCQIDQAIVENRVLISLSNLAPWNSIIQLESLNDSNGAAGAEALLSDAVLWERIDDGSFESMNGLKLTQGLDVAARQTLLLRSRFPVPPTSQVGMASWRWSSRVAGGDRVVDQIKKNVTEIVERVGMLSDPASNDQLNNGSFETVGEMGLVGWLHAQHPPGCVVVDSEQASDGAKSIRLKTDQAVSARTWLVSDTIEVPASGRLAVSMALRGDQIAGEPSSVPHPQNRATVPDQGVSVKSTPPQADPTSEKVQHLRVSLEGTQAGVPIRKSADVEIQRSGIWQPRRIVLEVDSIDPSTTDSLRLTIDSMTPGLVWIDDVRLHDDFSTARERTDLQRQAFLAVEGLHRGNLTPSANLLMNRWASRLLEQSDQSGDASEKPLLSTESAKSNLIEDVPEVANRNRVWLLERLRF